MKIQKQIFAFLSLFLALFAMSCSEDSIDPRLEELRNQEYDLIVVSDANPRVPVSFTAAGTNLERVEVSIAPAAGGNEVAKGILRNIIHNSLNRVNMNVNFPGNDEAPSGLYTVSYTMISKGGQQSFGSYTINVINNVSPVFCEYTSALPQGKSVWIRLYVPNGETLPANDNTIYLTGSFGSREGGSDWDGGGANSPFVFKRLSATCYELAVNLQAGDEFKVTRGNWDKQMTKPSGADSDNTVYNGEEAITLTAYNWKDQPTVTPDAPASEVLDIPSAAVKPGMLTVVVDLPNAIDAKSGDYYVVEKGATSLAGGFKMVAFEAENKLAAAVAKKPGAEYVVVRNTATAVGRNRYGFEQSVVWDGRTNPLRLNVGTFDAAAFNLGNKIVIVGGATPGDWGVSSGQDFTRTAPGKYELTIRLNGNSEYLLLPDYGQWGDKWAFGDGTPLAGTFANQGSGENLRTTGLETGNYKIEVDFTRGNGSYKLTRL